VPPPAPPAVDSKAIKAKMTMGDFHYGRGEYDDAIANYEEGLKLDPSNADLRQKLDVAIKACKKESAILNEGFKCGGN
jgi:tetratricopeptide (TPR) repeat protein